MSRPFLTLLDSVWHLSFSLSLQQSFVVLVPSLSAFLVIYQRVLELLLR